MKTLATLIATIALILVPLTAHADDTAPPAEDTTIGTVVDEQPTPPTTEDIVCPPETPNLIDGVCYAATAEPGTPEPTICPADRPNLINGKCYAATAEPNLIECDDTGACNGLDNTPEPQPETTPELAATGTGTTTTTPPALAVSLVAMIIGALAVGVARRADGRQP